MLKTFRYGLFAALLLTGGLTAAPAQAAPFTASETIGDGILPDVFTGSTDLWRVRTDSTGTTSSINAAQITTENSVSSNFGLWNRNDVTYVHDMNWVSPSWSTVTSATLQILAFGPDGSNDSVIADSINLGSLTGDGRILEFFTLTVFNASATVLGQLTADGKLNITIDKVGTLDPLNITASRLLIEYDDQSSTVPEPTSIALLGLALVGGAARLRRRQ